jgi:hypothetical protein
MSQSASASESGDSYKAMPCAQFIPDKKQRNAFFNECAKKEKVYSYLNAELAKRAKIIPKIFALCASLCESETYPHLKLLPSEIFDTIFPRDGLQSCHWQLMLDQSNGFLAARLAHFNEWVGQNGLPQELVLLRNEHVASLASAAAATAAREEAAIAAATQQLSANLAISVQTTQMVMNVANDKLNAMQQIAAAADQRAAFALAIAATLPAAGGGSSSLDPTCWYCQHNKCNQH